MHERTESLRQVLKNPSTRKWGKLLNRFHLKRRDWWPEKTSYVTPVTYLEVGTETVSPQCLKILAPDSKNGVAPEVIRRGGVSHLIFSWSGSYHARQFAFHVPKVTGLLSCINV